MFAMMRLQSLLVSTKTHECKQQETATLWELNGGNKNRMVRGRKGRKGLLCPYCPYFTVAWVCRDEHLLRGIEVANHADQKLEEEAADMAKDEIASRQRQN